MDDSSVDLPSRFCTFSRTKSSSPAGVNYRRWHVVSFPYIQILSKLLKAPSTGVPLLNFFSDSGHIHVESASGLSFPPQPERY